MSTNRILKALAITCVASSCRLHHSHAARSAPPPRYGYAYYQQPYATPYGVLPPTAPSPYGQPNAFPAGYGAASTPPAAAATTALPTQAAAPPSSPIPPAPAAPPVSPTPTASATPMASAASAAPLTSAPPLGSTGWPPPASPAHHARMATLILQRVIVSPHKPDGRAWDCCASISPKATAAVSDALSRYRTPAAQAAGVLLVLAPYAGQQTSAPDVAGSAALYAPGRPRQTIGFNNTGHKDDYAPMCETSSGQNPTWEHVPLESGTRLIGRLHDRDLTSAGTDDIGPFEINARQIAAALANSNIFTVRVPDPSSVLFVQFSVVPE